MCPVTCIITCVSKCAQTVTYDFSSVVTKCGVHRVPYNMYNYMCVTSVVPPELSTVCSKCAETVTHDVSRVVTKCGVHRFPCQVVTCIITCVLKSSA